MSEPLDLREINIFERHTVLFEKLLKLKLGERFVFINDHEPRPLFPELLKRGFKYESRREAEDKWVIEVVKEK